MVEPMGVSIRRAGPGDADLLAEFAARTFRATFAADNRPEDMDEYIAGAFGPARQGAEIAAADILTLLATVAGPTAAAFAQLRTGPAPACVVTTRPVELWRFYVDRTWHGKGIAQRLMTAAVAEAAALGAGSLWLGVWERNHRAAAFYRKCGFVAVGTQEFRLGQDLQTDKLLVLPRLGDLVV